MSLNPEDIKEAMEIAEEDAMERLEALAEIYAPDGMTWDMEKITDDRQFIAWYIDLENRPGPRPFSIMDYLPSVSPELFKSITTRFERARANLTGA